MLHQAAFLPSLYHTQKLRLTYGLCKHLFQSDKNKIFFYLKMCGNEISSVSNPNGDFYQLVSTQIPSRKIIVKNYPISANHTIQLDTLNLTGIRELRLQKCRINHQTMQQLATLSLPVLARLNLNDNELGPIGCRILSSSSILSSLTELSLNNNKIKDVGLKALANADLTLIEDLSLSDNHLTSEGMKTLQGQVDSLQCLNLGSNRLNNSSVAALCSINPNGIYFLKLSRNEITEEGLKQLIDKHKNLDVLLIEKNKIKEDRQKFKRKGLFLFY